MGGVTASDPDARARRREIRDGWRRVWMNGLAEGISGAEAKALVRAYFTITAIVLFSDSINVLSVLHDAARIGRRLPVWVAITDEGTSGTATLAACGLVYLAMRVAPLGRAHWSRVLLVYGLTSVLFSGVHVAGMVVLRVLIFATQGLSYKLPMLGDLLYEYRKDLFSYIILMGVFWLFRRPVDPTRIEPSIAALPTENASFDIVDGAATLRTRLSEILAVRAAGNYVEFLLNDGRQLLMRASMVEVEGRLAPQGFLRTHRSWLVNPAQLRGFQAIGSGDYRLDLANDLQAPLSRRYPTALQQIRKSGA